jgi:hypothetical protein
MHKTHVDRLVAENMVEPSELTQEDKDLINGLSTEEVDAVIRVGIKVRKHRGKDSVRVVF